VPYKEREIEKKYFSIGEVADMFKVAASLIRYWEGEFDIIRPKKDKKGNRRYTKDDIQKIRYVYHLVKENFSFTQPQVAKIPRIGRRLLEIRQQRESLLSQAAALLANQTKDGYRLLTALDEEYPKRLKANSDAPVLLFTKGTADLNASRTVGIVGTRSATPYGRAITKKICEDLLPYQPSIVSGLAYGIDIEAHRSALNLGLPTIAVLGSPIHLIYPAVHQGTAAQLVQENGALLSEYGPGSRMLPGNFPARNRIIALLSDALLVVEAAKKGGALIPPNSPMATRKRYLLFLEIFKPLSLRAATNLSEK